MVGKSYSISVGDKFEISVGDSKLTMTPDGIVIAGKSILIGAEGSNTIIGDPVAINPGATSHGADGASGAVPVGGAETASNANEFGGVDSADSTIAGAYSGGGAHPNTKGEISSNLFELSLDDDQNSNALWTGVNEGLAYVGKMFDKVTGVPMAVGEPVFGGLQGAYTIYDKNLRTDYNNVVNGMTLDTYKHTTTYRKMQNKVDWEAITQKYGHGGFEKAKPEIYQKLMNN